MEYSLRFCFDQYQACPVYREQLAERLARRVAALERNAFPEHHAPTHLVQISLPDRYRKPAA